MTSVSTNIDRLFEEARISFQFKQQGFVVHSDH